MQGERFEFHPLKKPAFSKEQEDLLFKWGLKDHLYIQKVAYDSFVGPHQIQEFVLELCKKGILKVLFY